MQAQCECGRPTYGYSKTMCRDCYENDTRRTIRRELEDDDLQEFEEDGMQPQEPFDPEKVEEM